MEWYAPAGQVYFSDQSQQAAAKYAASPGVDRVIAVVDGRMDGGEDWSPDLSKRTTAEVEAWADETATVYCSYAVVAGLQIDLEPITPKYLPNLLVFLGRLSDNLRSPERNCVSQVRDACIRLVISHRRLK